MKKILKFVMVSMMIMGLMISALGCGGQAADNPADYGSVKKIVAGTNAAFPPFESQEGEEYVGFDMDLIRAIGEVEGYEVEIRHMGFKALIPALDADKIDCAIAGMSINPDRLKKIDFSEPYFDAGLIIAVSKDTEGINGLEDLKGKRLAAEKGTTGSNACVGVQKKDSSTVVKNFDKVPEAFMELNKGGVDAVINDQAVTLNYIETSGNDKVKTVGDVFSAEEQYGIGVKKGNEEMLNVINDGLKKLQENGEFQKIYDKWISE